MQQLIDALVVRDKMTEDDARELCRDVKNEVLAAIHTGGDPEEVFTDLTGLEPDYLDFLGVLP